MTKNGVLQEAQYCVFEAQRRLLAKIGRLTGHAIFYGIGLIWLIFNYNFTLLRFLANFYTILDIFSSDEKSRFCLIYKFATNTNEEAKEKAHSCPKGCKEETTKRVHDSLYEWKAEAYQSPSNNRRHECGRFHKK
jgi:hypothetical protein